MQSFEFLAENLAGALFSHWISRWLIWLQFRDHLNQSTINGLSNTEEKERKTTLAIHKEEWCEGEPMNPGLGSSMVCVRA